MTPQFIARESVRQHGGHEMGAFDPVPWETVEAAIGPPAAAVTDYVDRLEGDVHGEEPYAAVKAIHDALAANDVERSVPGLGDPFLVAYLLEKRGVIDPHEEGEYRSLVARRPSDDRIEELFHEREYTLWWIATLTGVHPSLVTYWCWEADVPLLERNFGEESMAAIRAYRESADG